jgi:hypothetical protein
MRYSGVRNQITAIIGAAVLLATFGCSGNPDPNAGPRSPEGQAAIKGRQVIAAADAVLTGVDAAMTAKQLPATIGLPIVDGIRRIGVEARDTLAPSLRVIDAAKTATEAASGAAKAQASLATMQAMLTGALSPIKDPATRDQVGKLLSQLTDAISQVQAIIQVAREPDPADVPALVLLPAAR